ncbi:dTDP-4-dehydrorhamnose reductase [Mesorhizobium sp. J428]|uniref:dTDP-4-dehydrorhamnose reductase n=1 Tax=Mesorhizobium sp. J428 TaxID=2898440 RepID=UPI002150F02E|nr:dTDP-4-dehydrorhamnose reductase [Mesorhizobium sp. J428]MCR5858789.1 dTDP-4-dehydrorhamnose reductase [Mesorhizobium sp. J428]
MRIAVTGREGQVAQSLKERCGGRADVEIVLVGRPDLDLATPASIAPALEAARPDLVVSSAAYTAVDKAEDEPALAHAVNGAGAGAVAAAAHALGVPVIHLSTDYVFDGSKDGAYVETDPTGPIGVYGASKLAGEHAVAAANPRHAILRTAWVYSPFGNNFVRTMLRVAASRDELTVVADQHGNPTSALDIADAVLHIAPRLVSGQDDVFGIFHLAGSGTTNWSGFARRIFEASRANGGPSARVKDIPASDYPTKARRPANSRLSTAKFTQTFGWTAPDWQDSTDAVVARLLAAPQPPQGG